MSGAPSPGAETPTDVDGRWFRHVVGHLASGVTVVTTARDAALHGMTVSSVTSLSADPPMMLACLNNSVPTTGAVSAARRYAVNILAEGGSELAYRFATPSEDKFAGVDVEPGPAGLPLLAAALAHIECEVTEEVVGGSHTIFIGRVLSASAGTGQPLTYFQGGFGRFEFARDDEIYRRARQQVIERVHAPDDVLTVAGLAESLSVDDKAAFYALTRLATDGLVRRDPRSGYVVTPFDAQTSDATFDARAVIEVGVVDQVVHTVTDDELAELRSRFEAMAALLVGDRFVDFNSYLDANYSFHEYLVSLAHNPALSATFGGLSIKQVMSRSFGPSATTSEEFVEVQRRITEALENRDKGAAQAAVRQYTDRAKQRAREILRHHGGRL